MSRPTMRDVYRARVAEEATKPLVAPPTTLPPAFCGFVDLDLGEDMEAFIQANAVRDRIGPELLRLVSTVHGGGDLTSMLLKARSPAFWIDLDRPDAYRAFHRVLEIRAVVSQAAALKRRH